MNDPTATCPFCAIVRRQAHATITYEDDVVLAFRDIAPMAPFHELVIPRRHIDSLASTVAGDGALLGWMMLVGRLRAEAAGGVADGFRVVMNHGRDGHQTVGHMHLHVLAGRPLGWPPG
ncbi:MAG TPA: HIT domain-containing protein [Polyangia bacterium]|nr:HIT domain-containing protein [Polyangia bacterium]